MRVADFDGEGSGVRAPKPVSVAGFKCGLRVLRS